MVQTEYRLHTGPGAAKSASLLCRWCSAADLDCGGGLPHYPPDFLKESAKSQTGFSTVCLMYQVAQAPARLAAMCCCSALAFVGTSLTWLSYFADRWVYRHATYQAMRSILLHRIFKDFSKPSCEGTGSSLLPLNLRPSVDLSEMAQDAMRPTLRLPH